jgi:hypothetical protein
MRLFTSVLLAEWSAQDIVERLASDGVEVETDVADAKLRQLAASGNLLPSPREVRVTSIAEHHRQAALSAVVSTHSHHSPSINSCKPTVKPGMPNRAVASSLREPPSKASCLAVVRSRKNGEAFGASGGPNAEPASSPPPQLHRKEPDIEGQETPFRLDVNVHPNRRALVARSWQRESLVFLAESTLVVCSDCRIRDAWVEAGRFWGCIAEPMLKGQLPHAAFPHPCCVSVAKCLCSDPRLAYTETVTLALKQPCYCSVSKWLVAPRSTINNEYLGRISVAGSFVDDVTAHCFERSALVQVHHSISVRLRTNSVGMSSMGADNDSAPPIFDVSN